MNKLTNIYLGGAFDPIHDGHIDVALHISKLFRNKVNLLISNNLHNKISCASLDHRIKMLKLVCAKYSKHIDLDLSQLDSNQVTGEFIIEKMQNHTTDNFFVMGSDTFAGFKKWLRWSDMLKVINIIVVQRNGFLPEYSKKHNSPLRHLSTNNDNLVIFNSDEFIKLNSNLEPKDEQLKPYYLPSNAIFTNSNNFNKKFSRNIIFINVPQCINKYNSSTQIRHFIGRGINCSELVDGAINNYIRNNALYLT